MSDDMYFILSSYVFMYTNESTKLYDTPDGSRATARRPGPLTKDSFNRSRLL